MDRRRQDRVRVDWGRAVSRRCIRWRVRAAHRAAARREWGRPHRSAGAARWPLDLVHGDEGRRRGRRRSRPGHASMADSDSGGWRRDLSRWRLRRLLQQEHPAGLSFRRHTRGIDRFAGSSHRERRLFVRGRSEWDAGVPVERGRR